MLAKTWLITGASRGFGRVWTEAALARGDKVAATARKPETLKDLVRRYGDHILPIKLDVDDHDDDFAAVKKAFDHFGTVDVVVNNAGYGLVGAIEEISEEEARAQLETNLFGALWITQAALPYLRKQGHGHIVQVSSLSGVAASAGQGLYSASKWGLEGFSEALSREVAPFGIRVTIIEPSAFATDAAGKSAVQAKPLAAYEALRSRNAATVRRGDPTATANAILEVVDAEHPPLRLLLGEFAADHVQQLYADRLKEWAKWEDVSRNADGVVRQS